MGKGTYRLWEHTLTYFGGVLDSKSFVRTTLQFCLSSKNYSYGSIKKIRIKETILKVLYTVTILNSYLTYKWTETCRLLYQVTFGITLIFPSVVRISPRQTTVDQVDSVILIITSNTPVRTPGSFVVTLKQFFNFCKSWSLTIRKSTLIDEKSTGALPADHY